MRVIVAMSGGVDSSVTAALMMEKGHEVIGVTLQLYNHNSVVEKEYSTFSPSACGDTPFSPPACGGGRGGCPSETRNLVSDVRIFDKSHSNSTNKPILKMGEHPPLPHKCVPQAGGEKKSLKKSCCGNRDTEDARKVCEKLGIPHYVLNYEEIFKKEVISDFVDSYIRGETPVPCIRCNQTVKFRDLLKVTQDLGGDVLLTGHYARCIEGVELHKAVNEAKDQSYFLFATTKEQLKYLSFPLGDMTKEETREHAKRFNLAVSNKPESQDICFVPDGSYADVIKRVHPEAFSVGEIIHIDGTVMGEHHGYVNYTVGQRKGLGISNPEPLYVIKTEPDTNRVYVGLESDLYSNSLYIKEINWLGDDIPHEGLEVTVSLRSGHKGATAIIYPPKNGISHVQLHRPERAITAGQACAVYQKTRVLGGGWIMELLRDKDV